MKYSVYLHMDITKNNRIMHGNKLSRKIIVLKTLTKN